jgi:heptosyltransferase II
LQPKKILLIRFSSIGDVVLTAPAVAALHEEFPNAEIHLLTKKALAPLWRGDPRVRVRSFDPQNAHFGLPGFFRFIRELDEEHYDAVVDLHALPKSRALTAALGVPVYRLQKASLARRWYVATKREPVNPVHVARRYVRALAPLGVPTEGPLKPEIRAEERARERLASMLQALNLKGRVLIGIAPGAQWATKQWGWAHYAELVDRLNARGFWVAIIGGKEDKHACEELVQGRRALNFAGLLDLSETLALMEYCRLVVSNDSGPMHMAGARGADVIGIFGSTTQPLGFAPLAERSAVVEVDLPCRPCSPHGLKACPLGHFRCMNDITVAQVWAAVENFIGPPPPPDDEGHDPNEGLFILSD